MPPSYTKKTKKRSDQTPVVLNDPLQWWKVDCHRFPVKADVSRRLLAIPTTSPQSERLFSEAGQIDVKRRSCLASGNVELLLSLHMVWPSLDEIEEVEEEK